MNDAGVDGPDSCPNCGRLWPVLRLEFDNYQQTGWVAECCETRWSLLDSPWSLA